MQKTYPVHLAGCIEQGAKDLPSSSGLLYRARCKSPTQFIWPVVQSKVQKTYPVHLACCTEQGAKDLPSSSGLLYRARCKRPTQFIWPVVPELHHDVHCSLPQQKPCLPDQPRLEHLHDVPVSHASNTQVRGENLFRPIAVFLRILEISQSKQLAVSPSTV